MDTKNAELIVDTVARTVDMNRYKAYVEHIIPRTPAELFRIWIFSYASVHTSWLINCRLFSALKDYQAWLGDADKLKSIIIATRAGMHNQRTRYLTEFSTFYWHHPDWFWKCPAESWTQYRDRLKNSALGIGPAKSSFVVELMYPSDCEVVCTDTHMMQAYGVEPKNIGKVTAKQERAMEEHWVRRCKEYGLPPALTRWSMWDQKMGGYSDSRYWSHVLERTNFHNVLGGQGGH